jgi:hypothetical protein
MMMKKNFEDKEKFISAIKLILPVLSQWWARLPALMIFITILLKNTGLFMKKKLLYCIDKLINQTITAMDWTEILVPFIASLFVRTPTFDQLFKERFMAVGFPLNKLSEQNTNYARLLEHKRLLAPILAAHWIVLKTSGKIPLITNDIGYAPFTNPIANDYGWAIPIGKKHIIVIIPDNDRIIAIKKNDVWFPVIDYEELPIGNHIGLNEILALYARRFILGADSTVVKRFLKNVDEVNSITEFAAPRIYYWAYGHMV